MNRILENTFSRHIKGFFAVSKSGFRERLKYGLFEIFPLLLFYLGVYIVAKGAFSFEGAGNWHFKFVLIVACVDSIGDALFLKGLFEHIQSLKKSSGFQYLIQPGNPLVNILFLRFDFPSLLLGIAAGFWLLGLEFQTSGFRSLVLLPCLGLGIVTHIVLTSSFHLVQAFFEPRMLLGFGNPASRLYTRPLHLILGAGAAGLICKSLYPVYFITAFASEAVPLSLTSSIQFFAWLLLGAAAVAVWSIGLNFVAIRSIRKWS
jgi:hypothetical protein